MTDVKQAYHDVAESERSSSFSSRRFSISSLLSSRRGVIPGTNKAYKYYLPQAHILAASSDTDKIMVPVHQDHLPRRKTIDVLARVNDRLQPGMGANEEYKMLKMSKQEYLKYWARDETGLYMGTEPEGEGHARLKAQGW